ncbi:MAG: hypothetical protein JF593_08545 [Novosphingobium sp.]|nr:hypothetical protein [Novosphingobium sp.]
MYLDRSALRFCLLHEVPEWSLFLPKHQPKVPLLILGRGEDRHYLMLAERFIWRVERILSAPNYAGIAIPGIRLEIDPLSLVADRELVEGSIRLSPEQLELRVVHYSQAYGTAEPEWFPLRDGGGFGYGLNPEQYCILSGWQLVSGDEADRRVWLTCSGGEAALDARMR